MSVFLKRVYSEIAGSYEKANHIFTFGLDILWRRRLARMVVDGGAGDVLDVCTGTGETARRIHKVSKGMVHVVGADFSENMLEQARKNSPKAIGYKLTDAARLPFPDGSFDAVTISFATRNLNSGDGPLSEYFREFRRVLKKGGVFYNLETSQPSNPAIRLFFRLYVRALVALIGRRLSGNAQGYEYLAGSILSFMGPDELAAKLKEADFTSVDYVRFLSGAVVIHRAFR